ncbi:bifunctional pyr operon transcriptional regulator/uracil phosphoribosyltransferase, partial [Streptomyces cavourensis]|nr:bifunctional pyr operon transcriptional regulator/uracil phosphoribosyltransferase [Streptomyces cavourensis]
LREAVKVQLAEEDGRDAVLLGVQQTAPADAQ